MFCGHSARVWNRLYTASRPYKADLQSMSSGEVCAIWLRKCMLLSCTCPKTSVSSRGNHSKAASLAFGASVDIVSGMVL